MGATKSNVHPRQSNEEISFSHLSNRFDMHGQNSAVIAFLLTWSVTNSGVNLQDDSHCKLSECPCLPFFARWANGERRQHPRGQKAASQVRQRDAAAAFEEVVEDDGPVKAPRARSIVEAAVVMLLTHADQGAQIAFNRRSWLPCTHWHDNCFCLSEVNYVAVVARDRPER